MKNKTLNSTNSPHLALVLDQFAKSGKLDDSAVSNILVSFETSFLAEGAQEIGFSREIGQSFNPRAARIMLILLKDAKILDEKVLMQAAQRAGFGAEYEGYLDLEEPLIVSAAFLLDRLRHLHLEKSQNPEKIYAACLKTEELLSRDFPQMSVLLGKGVERMKRSLG